MHQIIFFVEKFSKEDLVWNPKFYKNAEINIKKVKSTINDLDFNYNKIMVCGRGTDSHPNFHPRFSTTSAGIDSELYVLVDHTLLHKESIKRNGNYALSLIVHPLIVQKIENLGGKIFWFSPEYLENDLPKITAGKYPKENSGLATISLASFFGAKKILLSGISFTNRIYEQFQGGKDVVFSNIHNNGGKIFSLDGNLAEKISIEEWYSLVNI